MKTAITIFLCLCSLLVFAQRTLSTRSKKAAELYYEADNFRVRGQYSMAMDLLNQAIQKDKNFHEAYFRLAIIYKAKGDLDKAEQFFEKVL
ncbi:MAG: tetratricopeptide repeat protein, partial [Cytophagales bacterium]|nr:tetratricopeptide repeat protein [Cytophagales bacterium]